MGWVLDTNLGEARYRRKTLELRAAGHVEVTGPHGWSLTFNSDRCLVSGFQPTPGPAPRLPLASHPAVRLSPPPSRFPGQSPTGRVAAHTRTFPAFWFSGELAASPHRPPPTSRPPSRNFEKLEGPADSPLLPQARSNWIEQLGRGDPGVWNMVI